MLRFMLFAAAVFSLFSAAPASAGLVLDYESKSFVTMSNLQNGQSGEIRSLSGIGNLSESIPYTMGHAIGSLDKGMKITFTFSSVDPFSKYPAILNPRITATAGYIALDSSGDLHSGGAMLRNSMTPSMLDYNTNGSMVNFTALPESLVLITSNFINDKTATLEIVNKSGFLVAFETLLSKFGHASGDKVTYNIAAVPLPAALPLFGAGLAGLVALRRRKKIAA